MKFLPIAFVTALSLCAEPILVRVPMRDGVLLATDVYGAEPGHPKPVLLARTPYNKAGSSKIAAEYVRHGYVVVIQDCGGRYASGGSYTHITKTGRTASIPSNQELAALASGEIPAVARVLREELPILKQDCPFAPESASSSRTGISDPPSDPARLITA